MQYNKECYSGFAVSHTIVTGNATPEQTRYCFNWRVLVNKTCHINSSRYTANTVFILRVGTVTFT